MRETARDPKVQALAEQRMQQVQDELNALEKAVHERDRHGRFRS